METLNVLVVDDEETTRRSMVLVLEDAGHKVTGAESGHAALGLFKRQKKAGGKPFDFLLFDIRMPGMTGLQLLEELEKLDIHLFSLAITGHADPDAAAELRSKGCHILQKPFHGEQLLERISTILRPPQQFPDA